MATTKDYRDYVMEELSILEPIKCRPMMGEYLLYYKDILFGGIYDNRLLIKNTNLNQKYAMEETIPYNGAKTMYIVNDIERELLKEIIIETCNDLSKKKD